MTNKGTKELATDRLILRRFTIDDVQEMYDNWASDPEVTKYLTWPPHASADVTNMLLSDWVSRYDSPDYYNWAIVLTETGSVIGNISVVRLHEDLEAATIGYCMSRKYWGRGIMPEVLGEVIAFLFDEVGLNRIDAQHDTNNPKSGRVMLKAGMKFEGIRRQGGRNNQGIIDLACYSVLKDEV